MYLKARLVHVLPVTIRGHHRPGCGGGGEDGKTKLEIIRRTRGMRIYNTYWLASFDYRVEHYFKAANDTEAIEKCKEYDMPPRSQLNYIKDSGKLHGVTFIKWIG